MFNYPPNSCGPVRQGKPQRQAKHASRRLTKAERHRRLARVKEAVECSEYENPLKLSVALDRLLDELK